MSTLAQFSIIVATDNVNGIAKNGSVPWTNSEDSKFFRDTTTGKGRNVVIMGRVTYESIPEEARPLKGRKCVIVSRTWKQENHPEVSVYPTLTDALIGVGGLMNIDEVFIVGGEYIYREAVKDFLYLCKRIFVTRFKSDYNCDQFFPYDDVKGFKTLADPVKMRDYVRYIYIPNIKHDEQQYLDMLRKIVTEGEAKADRTGVGTRSIFGGFQLTFDISERLPVITTKKVSYDNIIKELLFFISGSCDTSVLSKSGVKIWEKNTSKTFLEDRKLKWDEGDAGPFYSHQWRHYGAEYNGCDKDYTGKGRDQLKELVEGIRKDPNSRRHILMNWNVLQVDQMALPPCHVMAQFNVSGDKRYLDCQMYQRSMDGFLGAPYNITSYCLLTSMIAHICNLLPRKFIYVIGDAHVYNNHTSQVTLQLKRTPRPFPKLGFRRASALQEIDDFKFDSFIIEHYSSWAAINGELAT